MARSRRRLLLPRRVSKPGFCCDGSNTGKCSGCLIADRTQTWRIMYFVAADAVVILDVFSKKTETTPKTVVNTCRQRLASYRRVALEKKR